MFIPETLHYYYESSRPPFLSLSELPESKFSALMEDFGNLDTAENRFDEDWKRDFYLFFRPYTEEKLRAAFIEKGGKPNLKAPRYFSLGPTNWFLDWYEEPAMIEIPLKEIPSELISFTYPDSMTSLLIAEDRFEPFAKFKQPYHGEVFRLDELSRLIEQYGFPDENDPTNQEYGNRIIEAQIWDVKLLEPYIEPAAPVVP